jgi:hypothetical protein
MRRRHFIDCPEAIILSHSRSGTHFLEASLGNHPKVHQRGECFLRYEQFIAENCREQLKKPPRRGSHRYKNIPDKLNIAILMYPNVPFVTNELRFSLQAVKIIHLLRNPRHVAISCAQMEADRFHFGDGFKAHYKLDQPSHEHVPIREKRIQEIKQEVMAFQNDFSEKLKNHPHVLTINYDEVTKNQQMNEIPERLASEWLNFLGLNPFLLKNSLKKTGNSSPELYG